MGKLHELFFNCAITIFQSLQYEQYQYSAINHWVYFNRIKHKNDILSRKLVSVELSACFKIKPHFKSKRLNLLKMHKNESETVS